MNSNAATSQDAFNKILRLVKIRDRSIKEVRDRLERDGYTATSIDVAIEKACEYNFLNDQRFAETLIRSRLYARKGIAGIIRELKSHNIDPETQLSDFPDAYLEGRPTQKDLAIAMLVKKPPHSKNTLQAAYAKLIRNGYSSSLASEAAREWYEIYA